MKLQLCLLLLLFIKQFMEAFAEEECKFPFTYQGKTYNSCTMDNSNIPWCSTDSEYNGNYIVCQNQDVDKECAFPFTYQGKSYNQCTLQNSDQPWCSLDEEYQGNFKYCSKKSEGECVLPFNYKGNSYSECIMEDSTKPWCSLDKDYIGNFKYCEQKVNDDCVFPFTYKNEIYTQCTMEDYNQPWCSTDEIYQGRYKICEKTQNGDCVFPFNYKGEIYSQCTTVDAASGWCSLDETYIGNYKYCSEKAGDDCVFPFEYRGETYKECTMKYSNRPWCSINAIYAGNYKYCDGDSESVIGTEILPVVTPSVQPPTQQPTEEPTEPPTEEPTEPPTEEPTEPPTEEPTEPPTEEPTEPPTEEPTEPPTEEPTEPPTEEPTEPPTEGPTVAPTTESSSEPPNSSCKKYGGRSYYFVRSAKNYNAAKAFCALYGFKLAHVYNGAHNNWLFRTSQSSKQNKFWIGLTDIGKEGTWKWEDGTGLSYKAWAKAEPNNAGGNEDCTEYGHFPNGQWNDAPCVLARNFICESANEECGVDPVISNNKPTSQISIDWNGPSSRAVDGNTNNNYGAQSCTHTALSNNAWWQVDLQDYYVVTRLTVYNRQDCCGERLSGFRVLVSDAPGKPFTQCAQGPAKTTNGQVINVNCNRNGRIVRIQLPGKQYLTLCEVRVYGRPVNYEVSNSDCNNYNGRSYYFVRTAKKYADAKQFCRQHGMTLVHVRNRNMDNWLINTVKAKSGQRWWIGLSDMKKEGTFVWDDGQPLTYKNWYAREPNDAGRREDCTEYGRFNNGQWNDINCGTARKFICETSGQCRNAVPAPANSNCVAYQSRTYYFVHTQMNYNAAKTHCLKYNMKVVHVRNAAMDNWLINTVKAKFGHRWWIGLSDEAREGHFVWHDGQAITYKNWYRNEPNNSGGNEHCTEYGRFNNGQWNDIPCSMPHKFICESNFSHC